MNNIENIDNDILNFSFKVIEKEKIFTDIISTAIDVLTDDSMNYEKSEKDLEIVGDEYSELKSKLIEMCNGDESVSEQYKRIAENILEEDYEAAELNKDSLLWYYQDQFKKYNNI